MKNFGKLYPGIHKMRQSNQPGMILIVKTWCPVCGELNRSLTMSREIDQLSNYIVIVLLRDDDEPEDKAFSPDGGYIPRVFFTNPNGNIMYDVYNNKGDPRYKYFYTSDQELIPNIRRVINFFS